MNEDFTDWISVYDGEEMITDTFQCRKPLSVILGMTEDTARKILSMNYRSLRIVSRDGVSNNEPYNEKLMHTRVNAFIDNGVITKFTKG